MAARWMANEAVLAHGHHCLSSAPELQETLALSAINNFTWRRVSRMPGDMRKLLTRNGLLTDFVSIKSQPNQPWMKPTNMKNSPCKWDVAIGKSIMLFLMVLISSGVGCNKNNSSTGPKADAKATWDFWQVIQEPVPRNTLYLRMQGFKPENASAQDLQIRSLLLRQQAETYREKANQITSAPIGGVDVDAANYGVKKANLLVSYAKMFDSAAELADKQNNLTSGEGWLVDYVFTIARHSDEGDDAWWNAGKEELENKAKNFGTLQTDRQSLGAYSLNLVNDDAQLRADEMQTRVALDQRYGKEYPTTQSLAAARPAPAPLVLDSEKLKTMQQGMMNDLIGRKITTTADGDWSFDSLSEFQTFDVTHGTNYGDVVDFDVSTHVTGFLSGEHNFHLLVTYQKYKGSYRLMFVDPF